MQRKVRSVLVVMALLAGSLAGAAVAQTPQVWVQVEAQPNRPQAEVRAQAYANTFPDVVGYELASGWFGIELGPYDPATAQARLATLRSQGQIPADSFVADGHEFVRKFWPAGSTATTAAQSADAAVQPAAPATAQAVTAAPATAAPQPVQETPAQAQQSESLLTLGQKQDLQRALAWFGVYKGGIDGAFGAGTRAAMAAWQTSQQLDPTGILTTAQRTTLMKAYEADQAKAGLRAVKDDNAGISIDLPMGMVAFSRYTPPFAHYDPANGSGVTVLLISTPGDQTTLSGLYSLLQTLSIVPTDGPRSLTGTGFDITGTSADRTTFAHAEITGRTVKGYLVSWGKGNEALMSHVLTAMKDSFRSTGPQALDASMVPLSASQKSGMVAGLSLRKPVMARSGFFVDAAGDVLTTTEVLKNCGRVTVGERHTATVVLKDDTLGLALLRPKEPLSPLAYATTAPAAPGVQAQIAVAGYPYQGVLPGAALTFGTFDAGQGLNGEANLRRLSLKAEPGDVGGPVLDDSGALVGMLLPAKTDGTVLPDGVRFALGAGPIATALAGKGITLASAQPNATPMAPEDLATLGRKMTVLVACWK